MPSFHGRRRLLQVYQRIRMDVGIIVRLISILTMTEANFHALELATALAITEYLLASVLHSETTGPFIG
jgi:hypothetical protein